MALRFSGPHRSLLRWEPPVADAALVLALGPGPVRRARPHPKAPVPRESVQPRVHDHLPARRIVVQDQRPRVVEQHLLGHPAETPERLLHAGEPVLLALTLEGPHAQPPRVAQRRHEQRDPAELAADLHPPLAEVDLQLLARARLEAHRRPRLRPQLTAQVRHRPLHRPQADLDPLLGAKLLAHHVGVAAVATKPFGQPRLQTVQPLRPRRRRRRPPAARSQPPLHRVARTAELRRDPLRSPAQRRQPHHRRHVVRCPHLFPPQAARPRVSLLDHVAHADLLHDRKGVSSSCRQGVSLPCPLTADGGRPRSGARCAR